MSASAVIYMLIAALVTGAARGRTLKQGGLTFNPPIIGAPVASPSAATGPWANFTREPQTLYIAVKMLNSSVVDSDEACATLCNSNEQCEFYSWCPRNNTGGCGIPAANATYSSTVPPGSCILSYDDMRNRTAVFTANGKSVPFMGGQFDPANAGAARRLQQAGGSVWTNFTNQEHRFYQAIDALPAITAQSAEECAQACNSNAQCFFWTLCPAEAGTAGCEVASFIPNASPQAVPAGTCLLSYDGTKDQLAYFTMVGARVTFVGGHWNQSDASSAPSSSPGPFPGISIPSIPGISAPTSPSPSASPSPSPSNTTLPGSVAIRTGWYMGGRDKGGQCYKWNGTALELDESKTYVATGNKKVDEAAYSSYHSALCGSPDTAGETMAKDLLGGGDDARMAFVSIIDVCPDASVDLFDTFIRYANPTGNQDVERVIEYAQAWQSAANELGTPVCATIVVLDLVTGKVTVTTVAPPKEA